MKSLAAGGSRGQVLWSLHALGGEATLGDLLTLTGLPRTDLDLSLDSLIACGQAQVRVLEHGDLTYHVSESESGRPSGLPRSPLGLSRYSRAAALARARRILFDRRTLRLLRAREGVLSLAELVEQTGLPLREAEKGGDLFFGFRNVKRQFLASHLLRRTLRLGSTVSGSTVFDSGDSREVAWRRELDAFDWAPTSSRAETGPDGRAIRSSSR